jgi:general secretion pathway protein B
VSLILDALRKADSERERETVPGLHAQPLPSLSAELAPRPRTQAWRWIPLGMAIGALVPAAWLLATRDTPQSAEERAATSPAQAKAAPAVPRPAAATAGRSSTAAASLPSPAPTAATQATPEARVAQSAKPKPVAEPAPWTDPDNRKGIGAIKAAPSAGAAMASSKPESSSAVASAPPPAATPVYAREQLPPDIRAELPNLVVGGSIYSPSPAARSVIINGRIYRENDALNPELVLEQIQLKAAVLRYKGYRFEIGF